MAKGPIKMVEEKDEDSDDDGNMLSKLNRDSAIDAIDFPGNLKDNN